MSSGEPIIVSECRNCKKKQAKGINFIRDDGISVFRCDHCGKNMRCGLTELVSNKQKESIESQGHAEKNRDRYLREMQNKMEEDEKQMENFDTLSKNGFLWAHHR